MQTGCICCLHSDQQEGSATTRAEAHEVGAEDVGPASGVRRGEGAWGKGDGGGRGQATEQPLDGAQRRRAWAAGLVGARR
jgi:hypothetical protein